VVVGGGFGGLHAVLALRRVPVQVTLLDRRNFHLFQPLLYQVATGGLSPANIAAPLREIFKRQRNVTVLLAEVTDLDVAQRRLTLGNDSLAYDTLVIATGARHSYFGHPDWEMLAPGLKSIEDATEIRRRILLAFERAERETDHDKIRALLTFVVIGAGPTGVELAGTLGEMAQYTLRRDFRRIRPSDARVFLIEGTERVLPPYPSKLSAKAALALSRLGVTVLTGALVTDIEPDTVSLRSGERIAAHTVLWAAGVQASPLGRVLERTTGVKLDRSGRVMVGPDLTVPGHPEIFVIGDLAHCVDASTGQPLPGIAPVAIQQGRFVAGVIERRICQGHVTPFRYKDHGSMATIGRKAAVADLGWLQSSGVFAWLAWLFIHLLYLVGFQNRLLVLMQWAWNYFTWNRAARLITGEEFEDR
jgi:NADH dehydrogenase